MRRVLNIHEVNEVSLDNVEVPEPGARDVMIDVKACGICGSDLSYIKWGGIMREPGGVTPIGHEAAGEISFVGEEVQGVSLGQRVAINPMMTPSNIGSGGPEVVTALPRLKHKLQTLISHHYALDKVLEALQVAATPQSAKVMIDID